MSPTFTLAIVLVVAQQPPAPTPSASQAALPLQARSRSATFLRSDEGFVTSMAFSPDGKTLAVGYARAPDTAGGVVLWDVAGRKRVVEEPLHVTEGSVSSLAFSPDEKTLAAGYVYVHGHYRDCGVLLWDVAGRKRVIQAPLPVREGRVESMAFSPDGKTLAVGYTHADNTPGGVLLWDVAGRKRVVEKPLAVTDGRLSSLAFTPDGKTLAAAYVRASLVLYNEAARQTVISVMLWDVAEHKLVVEESLPINYGNVEVLVVSPDCKTLAAGYSLVRGLTWDNGVLLWNVGDRPGGN